MMRCLIFILLLPLSARAQINLVPNPSFEEERPGKPTRTFTHGARPFFELVAPWYTPTRGTSDYHNSDRSNVYLNMPVKNARTGVGRTGVVLREHNERSPYTEYIQVRLLKPLVKDSLYCVGMHFSLDKRCSYYTASLGICFTSVPLTDTGTGPLKAQPQIECTDTVLTSAVKGWQPFFTLYRASGGEQYMTIGRFENGPLKTRVVTDSVPKGMQRFSRCAYYYYDDISVVPLNKNGQCSETIEEKIKPAQNHFVFLVDVSASMVKAGYFSQVKTAVQRFADTLAPNDQVTLLAFDARTRVVLRAIKVREKQQLAQALENLQSGNVTNIDKAISRTYEVADSTYVPIAGNHVVLFSDAVFDVSSMSRAIIKNHFRQRGIRFSMVQLGNASGKKVQKIIRSAGGIYHTGTNGLQQHLLQLVKHPYRARHEYTSYRAGALTFEEH